MFEPIAELGGLVRGGQFIGGWWCRSGGRRSGIAKGSDQEGTLLNLAIHDVQSDVWFRYRWDRNQRFRR